MGALGFLLFAALARIRGMGDGRERDLAVALFAGAVAWVVHSFVDFDWDIPGVTIPALLFLGVLVAIPVRRDERSAAAAPPPPRRRRHPRRRADRAAHGRARRWRASCSAS